MMADVLWCRSRAGIGYLKEFCSRTELTQLTDWSRLVFIYMLGYLISNREKNTSGRRATFLSRDLLNI